MRSLKNYYPAFNVILELPQEELATLLLKHMADLDAPRHRSSMRLANYLRLLVASGVIPEKPDKLMPGVMETDRLTADQLLHRDVERQRLVIGLVGRHPRAPVGQLD